MTKQPSPQNHRLASEDIFLRKASSMKKKSGGLTNFLEL